MKLFSKMKEDLLTVNHTDVKYHFYYIENSSIN